jgi:hypothetical protein
MTSTWPLSTGRKKSEMQRRFLSGWRGKVNRSRLATGLLPVPDDQVIAVAVALEVSVCDRRAQDALFLAAPLEGLKDGNDLVLDHGVVFGIGGAPPSSRPTGRGRERWG